MAELRAGNLGDLLLWLDQLRTPDFRYELEKLRAIRDWAFRQAGIGYREGGRVVIRDGFRVPERNSDGSHCGWWHYRECLAGGATGIAVRIDFSPRQEAWYADLELDREWSVTEMSGRTVRHWHGPALETPDGYEPPGAYDQEHYPYGRRHVFAMKAANLMPWTTEQPG